MLDAQELRCFLAVAETLHFGRAAERLRVAQPPLSRTIKRLERKLGTVLFDRNTRSVELTASGRALVEPASEALEALRRVEDAVRAVDGGEAGLVRIGFAGASTHGLLADLAREVRSSHPGIQLELFSQTFAQPAIKRIVAGDLDLALGRWDVIPSGVDAEVVMKDSLVVAMPDSHRLAGSDAVSIRQFEYDQFVSLPPHEGSVLVDRLHRMAQSGAFIADVVQVVPDTHTALALVSAQVGCHLTLASVARAETDPRVVFVPIAEPNQDVDLRAAWRAVHRNPALDVVIDDLRRLSQGRATSSAGSHR